ncbi:hypothetical protein RHSIM_Rhsim04G0167100 [Rhododendron simsii]|uniref:ATP-dependent Clp protease proteolytic subunit n=1 Tax=Rhododendron simsii TaxID=118357 RepID=A0A834HAD2_RHOSS|nr:hypothetical protein RHSIM_Rhsim04G0167100 [Rhododendron simsii]
MAPRAGARLLAVSEGVSVFERVKILSLLTFTTLLNVVTNRDCDERSLDDRVGSTEQAIDGVKTTLEDQRKENSGHFQPLELGRYGYDEVHADTTGEVLLCQSPKHFPNTPDDWKRDSIFRSGAHYRLYYTLILDNGGSKILFHQILFKGWDFREFSIAKPHSISWLHQGLAIYDTMQYIRSPVSTICMGQAASMGSLLLAAGAKGERRSLPHSTVMIHQPSGGYSGQAKDMTIHTKQIIRIWDSLNELYVKHTGQPIEVIQKNMDRDYFMTPEEAKEFGIIDEVIDRRQLALVADAVVNDGKDDKGPSVEGPIDHCCLSLPMAGHHLVVDQFWYGYAILPDRKPPPSNTIINAAINHHLLQEIAPPPPPSITHSFTNTTTVETHLFETPIVEATTFIYDIQKMWLLWCVGG